MRVLILGGDGYLGWPTAMHMASRGHEVMVVDNFVKRMIELEESVEPLHHIPPLRRRIELFKDITGKEITLRVGDLMNHRFIYTTLDEFEPEAIVHYAEQPSAPYSMQSRETAVMTQQNNVIGNLNLMFAIQGRCPDAHLVKLGTMGEYGTPNIDIEEGYITIDHNGRQDTMLYPKLPGSFYHLSKVHDSHNIHFACRIWGMRATDLNQGVVYGLDTEETALDIGLRTSFHYDDIFGTVLNRFVVQAITGTPLTVYGKGGQTRGYLNIKDTLQCVELACNNPAEHGEFRVFNQFTEQFSVMELAEKVVAAAKKLDIDASLTHLENPRIELEDHYYNAKHSKLIELGLLPHLLTEDVITDMIQRAMPLKDKVDTSVAQPRVRWKSS